jgi:hypothetical protein
MINDLHKGFRVITSDLMVIGPIEDWSEVRSPSRAARRRKQGHRQRIKYVYLPDPNLRRMGDTLVGHPVTVAKLDKAFGRGDVT